MFRKGTVYTLLTIAVLLTACGQGNTVTQSSDPEEIYRSCIGCHGHDLSGRSGPSLIDIEQKYGQDDIVEIIMNGKGRMPAIKDVSEEQANILAEWLIHEDSK